MSRLSLLDYGVFAVGISTASGEAVARLVQDRYLLAEVGNEHREVAGTRAKPESPRMES
jgi:hypothetical protein